MFIAFVVFLYQNTPSSLFIAFSTYNLCIAGLYRNRNIGPLKAIL